jgi:acetyltransferase-like isoleucine patch superfamily enzyme
MLIDENDKWITTVVTDEFAQRLADRKVFRRAHHHQPIAAEAGHVCFRKNAVVEPYANYIAQGHFASMGAFSYTWSKLDMDMTVGRYCSISWNLKVIGFQHPMGSFSTSAVMYAPGDVSLMAYLAEQDISDYPYVQTPQKDAPKIGHDVWIGMDVTLARGIEIGTGAILAAGAMVTKNVEPYAIVGGNPARVIRYRFPEEMRARLLASQWWDVHLADLRGLDMHNPERFIDNFERAQMAGDLRPFRADPIGWEEMKALAAG